MCHSCVLYCSIIYQAEEVLAVASILLPKNDGFRSWRVVFKPDALCYRSLSQVPVWMIRRVDATVSQIRPQPIDYLDSQFPPPLRHSIGPRCLSCTSAAWKFLGTFNTTLRAGISANYPSSVPYWSFIYQAEELLAVVLIFLPKLANFGLGRLYFKQDSLGFRKFQVPVWRTRRDDAIAS